MIIRVLSATPVTVSSTTGVVRRMDVRITDRQLQPTRTDSATTSRSTAPDSRSQAKATTCCSCLMIQSTDSWYRQGWNSLTKRSVSSAFQKSSINSKLARKIKLKKCVDDSQLCYTEIKSKPRTEWIKLNFRACKRVSNCDHWTSDTWEQLWHCDGRVKEGFPHLAIQDRCLCQQQQTILRQTFLALSTVQRLVLDLETIFSPFY